MTLTQNYPQLKKLPQWLTILLVILLGITLAKFLWIFLTPEEKMLTEETTTQSNVLATPKKQQNYGKIIAGQHLFGVLEKKVVAPPQLRQEAEAAPELVTVPKLNIKLYGIMAYGKKESGYALLSHNSRPQKVYAVGESLDEKDKDKKIFISEVTVEKVVISNHGRLEAFLLPKIGGELRSGIPAIGINTTPPSSMRATAAPPGSFPSPVPTESRDPRNARPAAKPQSDNDDLSIDNMVEFREKIMADPSKLMEIASARPYSKDGELIGFRVRAGKRRQLFRQLGLRNGDIVKEVNGMQLDSAEKGIMLMGELSGASELTITVLRGKREVQLPTLHF
jgi:general secretion pathway protein C